MKYFLLQLEKRNNTFPEITTKSQTINPKLVCKEKFHQIPDTTMLYVKSEKNIVFPEILMEPVFLVSETFMRVMSFYDKGILYKRIGLFDNKTEKSVGYYLPLLDEKDDCLAPESIFDKTGQILIRPVLNEKAVRKSAIFKIGGVTKIHVVVRLDFIESILRRSMAGIQLKELEVKMNGDQS